MSRGSISLAIKQRREDQVKKIDMDKLSEKVVENGSDPERLKPLLLYKGGVKFARIQSLLNFFYMMVQAECESGEDVRLLSLNHHDGAHLCGLHNKSGVQTSNLYGFLGRLQDNRDIFNGNKESLDYLDFISSKVWVNIPNKISEFSLDHDKLSDDIWWRTGGKYCCACNQLKPINEFPVGPVTDSGKYNREHLGSKNKNISQYCFSCWEYKTQIVVESRELRKRELLQKREELKPYDIAYPFKASGVTATHHLLETVHHLVPDRLPREIRADVCQDLIVAVLVGDISIDNLKDQVPAYVKKVFKMFPIKYGHLSLDQVVSGTDGLTLMETLYA